MTGITKARFMDGLVLWLPMTEGAGTVVKDQSMYQNNGVFGAGAAAPSWVSGRDGLPGVSFDGGDHISVGHNASINFERTDPFTFSLWLKTNTGVGYPQLIAKRGDSTLGFTALYIRESTGYVGLSIRDLNENLLSVWEDEVDVTDNQDHLITVTHDGSSLASGVDLYTDGILRTRVIDVDGLSVSILNTDALVVCANFYTAAYHQWLTGIVSDVRIYDRALDPYEIRALYEQVRKI